MDQYAKYRRFDSDPYGYGEETEHAAAKSSKPRNHGAQIVFTQTGQHSWRAAFVSAAPVKDRQDARNTPAYMICRVDYQAYDGAYKPDQGRMYYELTTQGAEPGGRRHNYYSTLDEAQAAAITWARRRFYTEG